MFEFDVWEGLYLAWLPIDRERKSARLTIELDYVVELPQKRNNYTHSVSIVIDTLTIDEKPPCQYELAADADIKCRSVI